jgi:hypothetical protein
MPTNPYPNIVAGATTGNTAASNLNGVGSDATISVKAVTNIASASEVIFYNSNTRILALDTGKYYSHNGTSWVEDTTTFPTFNTVYTKTQVDSTTNGISSTVSGKVDKVGSSVVDNFVSFSNTSGVQKDSGKNATSFISNDTTLSSGAGGVVVNDAGSASLDLRVEGDTEANMIFNDASADILYLGGDTNAVKIGKGGEITLIGSATRWEDLRVEITVRSTGQKAPTLAGWLNGLYLYEFDDAAVASEKEVFFAIQMPHGWKEGSTIFPHVHWTNKTAGSAGQVARWGLEYNIAKPSAVFGSTTTIYGETIGSGVITSANSHLITPIGAGIDMTGMSLSTMIVGRLFRNSSHANDTYGGIAGGLSFDIHYEVDSFGSSLEYTK